MKKRYLTGLSFLYFLVLVVAMFVLVSNTKIDDQPVEVSTGSSQFEQVPKLMLPVLAETLGRDNHSYHIQKSGSKFKAITVSHGIETEFERNGVTFSRNNNASS